MYSLVSLARDYLPRELPPVFTTHSYETYTSTLQNGLPKSFATAKTSRLLMHEVARFGLRRRMLAIPNPIAYLNLSSELVNARPQLHTVMQQSVLSLSSPYAEQMLSDDERDTVLARYRVRSVSRYVLQTDIAKCYPSIYTHSIPWAIHTKKVSKADRTLSLLGNRIDKLVRDAQDGQTIGIPIGPRSSHIIAETILCQIDAGLQQIIPNLIGVRFRDDYEFGFETHADAERCLAELRGILKEYELEINLDKTDIFPLPRTVEAPWRTELSRFNVSETSNRQAQANDLLGYFNRIFEFLNVSPHEHILTYGLSRLLAVKIHPDNWKLLENFLFQCLLVDSSTMLHTFTFLQEYEQRGYQINSDAFAKVLTNMLRTNIPLRRTSELSWAIWAVMRWEIALDETVWKQLAAIDESILGLLLLHARDKGLTPKIDLSHWSQYLNETGLCGHQWLMSYEAGCHGWLSSSHVIAHPQYSHLHQNNVHLYDESRVEAVNLRDILNRVISKDYQSTKLSQQESVSKST